LASLLSTAMAIAGFVEKWNPEKGFGFITAVDGTKIFAHQNQCADGKTPQEGDAMTFDVEESKIKPGSYQACNLSGGSGPPVPQKHAPQQNQFAQPGQFGGPPGGFSQPPNPNHVATGTFTGSVKSFATTKGYGFIIGPDGSENFVHVRHIADGQEPRTGDTVTFDIEASKTEEGKYTAVNVAGGTGKTIDLNAGVANFSGKNTNHVATGTVAGKVKSWGLKGFGFILGPDGCDIFAHSVNIADGRGLKPGDDVTFDIDLSENGDAKMIAKNVAGGTGFPLDGPGKGGKCGKSGGDGGKGGKIWDSKSFTAIAMKGQMQERGTPNMNHVATGTCAGTVKSFAWQMGYGFIIGPDGSDIFAHYHHIVDGQSLMAGDDVTFDLELSQKGDGKMVAVNIAGGTGWVLLDGPGKIEGKAQGKLDSKGLSPRGPNTNHFATGTMNGTVKSFGATKGFGFILGPDGSDIFVHAHEIADGKSLRPNDQVSFDVEMKDDGKMVAKNVAGGTGWDLPMDGGKGGKGDAGKGDSWDQWMGCGDSYGPAKGEGKSKDGPYGKGKGKKMSMMKGMMAAMWGGDGDDWGSGDDWGGGDDWGDSWGAPAWGSKAGGKSKGGKGKGESFWE